MKELVERLKNKLENTYNINFDMTGEEIINKLKITESDFYRPCERTKMHLYNNISLYGYVESLDMLDDIIFDEEIWCDDKDNKLNNELIYFEGSTVFFADPQGLKQPSIVNIVKTLQKRIKKGDFKVVFRYFEDCSCNVYVFKDNVKVEFDFTNVSNLSYEDKEMLFYQLLLFSYDTTLNETFKLLGLI